MIVVHLSHLASNQNKNWFRNKLGTIILGDGRVECDWSRPNSDNISILAGGADDKKVNIPPELSQEIESCM